MKKKFGGQKVSLVDSEIKAFLNNYYSAEISQLGKILSGNHSQAYSYCYKHESFVLRVSTDNYGYLKDQLVFKKLTNENIPVPYILDIGIIKEEVHFCISKKIEGDSIRNQYKRGDYSSFKEQFDYIERISKIAPMGEGFGQWNPEGQAFQDTINEYIDRVYNKHDWAAYKKFTYFDADFALKMKENLDGLISHSSNVRELVHGDFGNDNLIIENGRIKGIIDWGNSYYGDHLFDVGRIVLYCPNREVAVREALDFYSESTYVNFKERILAGVYFTMMANYGFAVLNGNEASCLSSSKRIIQTEELFNSY